MRKTLLVALTALCMLQPPLLAQAGVYDADGNFKGTVSLQVSSLFSQYPNGGQALADAIAALLTAEPGLAADVAYYASTSGSLEQQAAAGDGMGAAMAALTASGKRVAARLIAAMVRLSANSIILFAASTASGGLISIAGVINPVRLGCTGSPC